MTTPPAARSARWLDAAVIILLVLGARSAVEGGFSFEVLGERVTSRSAWRLFALGAALFAIRHWRMPRPWLGARIASGARRWRDEPFASIARLFVASRVGVLAVGLLAVLTFGRAPDRKPRVSEHPLRDLPARWDATWYVDIGRAGYTYDPRLGPQVRQSIAFFPAYPALIGLASILTEPRRTVDMTYDRYVELRDSRLAWAGTAVALACFCAALVVLYRWADARAGPTAAAGTIALLSAYPFALFFSAAYTEALFLLAAVAAFHAFERERWTVAAAWGLVAGLTRPNGAMLSVALAVLALAPAFRREQGWGRALPVRIAVAAAPGIGMLLYAAYVYALTGDAFAWVKVQQAWGRTGENTANYYDWMYRVIRDQGFMVYLASAPTEFLQALAVLFSLAMVWPVWRRVGAAYAVFVLANLLPPLFKGGVLSMGRMTSTMFPLFLAMSLIVGEQRRVPWLLAFALLQGLLAAMFFTWRPVF
jgi:hypothetical protein